MLHFILCCLQFAGAQAGRSQGWVQQGGMLLRKKRYAERSSILSGCTVLCWSQVSFICCFHKPVLPLSNSSLAVWTRKAEQAQMEASMPISGYCVYTTYQCWRPHKTILSCLIWFDGLAWENKTHWYPFISMKIPLYHHWKSIFQSANASGAVWPCLASRPRWVALQNHGTYAGFLQLLRKPSAWHPARVEELCRQGDWWDWMGTDGNWWEHVDDGVLPFNLVVLVRFFEVFGGLK